MLSSLLSCISVPSLLLSVFGYLTSHRVVSLSAWKPIIRAPLLPPGLSVWQGHLHGYNPGGARLNSWHLLSAQKSVKFSGVYRGPYGD